MQLPETVETRKWDETVAAEQAQTERVRERAPVGDFWQGLAGRFRPRAAGETEDPAVTLLAGYLGPGSTLLDVGAGGGRLAVPLADYCARVVAVEPSQAMREQLEEAIGERAAHNVEIVPITWEQAKVGPVDLVMSAHVLYTVTPIAPFMGKMIEKATQRVAVVLNDAQPQVTYYPLWPRVHGEERIPLPGHSSFVQLLDAWGIEPEILQLPEAGPNLFPDRQTALDQAMRRMFLAPGSAKARRLEQALDEALEPAGEGRLQFKWATANVTSVVTWAPGSRG